MSDIGNLGSSGASSDSLTETTSTSWLSRIGQSIKGVLFGLVLVIAAAVGLFWNEGRAVQTERSLGEGGSVVVDADTARVDPAGDGKLVHLTGDLKTSAKLIDPGFCRRRRGRKTAAHRRDVSMEGGDPEADAQESGRLRGDGHDLFVCS